MTATLAIMRTAFADSRANRRSFALVVILMVINDASLIVFWSLFFGRVGTIRGWERHDIFVLFAILLTGAGIALGLFSNCRKVGQLAADGALDEVLALPVSPLGMLLTKRVDPANIGDLVFGPVVFLLLCAPTPERAVLYLFGSAIAAVVMVSFLVTVGALTFFVGGRGEQAELGFQALLIFSSYPIDLFGGATKVLLFTVVPAAFVTGLPALLVRHFNPGVMTLLVLVAAGFAGLAWATFTLGLRRYSSGSLWSR